jgi:hypothetical protein
MTPVPQSLLADTFRSVAERRIDESNLEGRCSVDKVLEKLDAGYTAKTLAAYVNDLANPTFFLIVGASSCLILDDPTCVVYLIYGTGEGDQTAERTDAIKTAESYGKLFGCDNILLASWTYMGARDTSALWKRLGFDEQERTFTKLI